MLLTYGMTEHDIMTGVPTMQKAIHIRKTINLCLILIFLILILSYNRGVGGEGGDDTEDDRETVNLYLKYTDDEHYMNSRRDDPDDENGVGEMIWDYGWDDGNTIVDQELMEDIVITGTYAENEEGDTFIVYLDISNPSFSSQDITLQLLDNGEIVAEGTETLGAFGSNDFWKLRCTDGSDGSCYHTFHKGDTMSLRMLPERNVNLDYMDGDAHFEFYTNQMSEETFLVFDALGNDAFGMEVAPRLPEETGLSTVRFAGHFNDALSFRDIHHVEIRLETPTVDSIILDEPTLTDGPSGRISFSLNWSIRDYVRNEDDAGSYSGSFSIVDLNENEFEYEDELYFIVSKYGAYIQASGNDSVEKSALPGKTVSYHLEILNAALVSSDTFEIVHNEIADDWNVLIEPTSAELDSGEWGGIVVDVTLPEQGEVGETLDLRCTVESVGSSEDDEYETVFWDARTTTRIAAGADIEVFYREGDSGEDGSEYEHDHSISERILRDTSVRFNILYFKCKWAENLNIGYPLYIP